MERNEIIVQPTQPNAETVLLQQLRAFLNLPDSQHKRRVLLEILDRLLQGTRTFMEETHGDYLAVVTDRFPNWSRRVEMLRWKGVNCHHALRELRERVSRTSPFALERRTSDDLRHWISFVRFHRRSENRLLQSALSLDIGGEA